MKKNEVKVGNVYAAKVSDKVVGVKIVSENSRGGWDGLNITTNKPVRIKSAQRLRGPWKKGRQEHASEAAPTAEETPTSAPVAETATEASQPATRAKKRPTTKPDAKEKSPSGLDSAVRVLKENGQPLNTTEMVKVMLEKGYWKTGGKTPANTLYSAILREIKVKGTEARFRKIERGKFELTK